MTSKKTFDKNWLIRGLITKICQERNMPDLKYQDFFLGDFLRLFKKLAERKSDLPSLTWLVETYDFTSAETDLTMSDILEELNSYYIEEQTTRIVQGLIKDQKNPDMKSIDIIDRVAKEVSVVRSVVTKAYTIDLQTDVDKVVEEYIKVGEAGTQVFTGFQQLDDVVRIRRGNLVGVCAPTGGGKTLAMSKILSECIKNKVPSMYFSLEMGMTEMMNRVLAATQKFPFSETHNYKVSPEDYGKAVKELVDVQTHIITRQSEGKIDLATIERYVVEHQPHVVFIDYLTLIDDDSNWNAEVSITKVLKRIALQNNVLVIFACQASTDSTRAGEVPGLTSVRGNTSFPHDTDVFIGVASKRIEGQENKMKIYFAVRKSRNGGFPEWSMRVNANLGEWTDSTGELF